DHALDRHVKDDVGPGVEVLGTVDVGEVTDAIDTLDGPADGVGVADVADVAFDLTGHVAELANVAARFVVQRSHAHSGTHQRPNHGAADESCTARDEVCLAHALCPSVDLPAGADSTSSGGIDARRVCSAPFCPS